MDAEKVADYDFALCAAGIDPIGTADELNLSSAWLAWGTYADDYYPDTFGRSATASAPRSRPSDSRCFFRRRTAPSSRSRRTPSNAASQTSGSALTADMTEDARGYLRNAVVSMVESWLWELDNIALNKIPDPIDYLEMRRRTFGAELTACLASIKQGDVVPPELAQHEAITSLENSAADYACMINDVFSYQKEIQYEGDVHNMLLVVQTFFDCSYEDALRIVEDVMTQRLAQFQRAAEIELPLAYADYDLDEHARAALDGRAAQLRDWIAAVLNWHRQTHRYAEEDLARHFHGPVSALTPGHGPVYWK